ncbi:zinc finger protein 862-like [Dysidea avara]|uniref:zinc finger protein 862-like n=1 Tax=Dysidea avara TaxID=196820 RepID=UPI0033316E3F
MTCTGFQPVTDPSTICKKFQARIVGKRNFSDRWITGAESIRTSNIRDHAHSEQHVHAMMLLHQEIQRAQGVSSSANAPIVVALNTLGDEERARLRVKFDISYYIAKEKLPFRKYPGICELETHHGVNVGRAYTTETASKDFTHYITEAQRMKVIGQLKKCKFFSVLLDGSTDSGNIENELIMAVWFNPEDADEKVSTTISYFSISRPSSTTAQGLFDLLQDAMQKIMGIQDITVEECSALVGVGTDGAAVNVAGAGLKGLVERQLPWVFWSWCMAHRLELAVRDALKCTAFDLVDDMLLRLYLIYENSPKKCRELKEICSELTQCLALDPEDGGMKPIRASGSRWVAHKWNAMKRILSKYAAYTSHLAALSEDSSVKSVDRSKLKGYYNKWVNAKYILGCAVFVDVLSPCVILSKVMQYDHLDILAALSSLLRSIKEIEKLNSVPVDQWPTFASTISKCTADGDSIMYQAQTLKQFDAARSYFMRHASLSA